MNELQLFENEDFGEIRTIEENGKVLFCGSDVAKSLGYSNTRDALSRHCKGVVKHDTLTNGGNQVLSFIPEGDLYRLITNSKLPSAEKFESWVFDEILPSIRKHGMYANDELLNNLDLLIKVATELKTERAENLRLRKQAELDKPKVLFAEKVAATSTLIDMGKMAKLLHDEHIEIGRNRLFEWLRNKKILMQNNIPYQQYIDNKCFIVKEVIVDTPYERKVCPTTYVTGKGQLYITERLRQEFVKEKLVKKVVL